MISSFKNLSFTVSIMSLSFILSFCLCILSNPSDKDVDLALNPQAHNYREEKLIAMNVSNNHILDSIANCVIDITANESKWNTYLFATQSNLEFWLSLPPTIELRESYNMQYNQSIDSHKDTIIDSNTLTFQQKGLGENKSNAKRDYCRILITFAECAAGTVPMSSDTFSVKEHETELKEMVDNEVGKYNIIGIPKYSWESIKGLRTLQVSYCRRGEDESTTNVSIYLLYNHDEIVKLVLSYREQEKELWQKDFERIISTFRWFQSE